MMLKECSEECLQELQKTDAGCVAYVEVWAGDEALETPSYDDIRRFECLINDFEKAGIDYDWFICDNKAPYLMLFPNSTELRKIRYYFNKHNK